MTHNIGDIVYINASHLGRVAAFKGTIKAISTTGVMRVEHEHGTISFMPNGWERGNMGKRKRLINQDAHDRIVEWERIEEMGRRINDAVQLIIPVNQLNKTETLAKLAEVIKMVEALPDL